jgi:GNAT superfamily N-acetyltransferase
MSAEHSSTSPGPIRVVPYATSRPDHRESYRALNLAWIERHFVVEPRDRQELDDPERHILARGGWIFMAERTAADGATEVLGTVALLREPDGACELAKMAVRDSARGLGAGRALGEAAIRTAREAGAPHVELLSNRALEPAISLYRALGFVEVLLPPNDYARANIKMVLDLGRATA